MWRVPKSMTWLSENVQVGDSILCQTKFGIAPVIVTKIEPILQFSEVLDLIYTFRNNGCFDDFVIYTGYYPSEIKYEIEELERCENIVIKYGRFTPNQEKHYDEVLGVWLASNNQYAERIS